MMKNLELRTKKQQEFAEIWKSRKDLGIYHVSPRFGKCAIAINIMKEYRKTSPKISIVIAIPENKIKESWVAEMKRLKFSSKNIIFSTHLSLHKYKDAALYIIDEIHLLSERQIENAKELKNVPIIGLTGTLSYFTERTLSKELGAKIICRYPLEQAIRDEIIADYQITVKTVSLDNIIKNIYKNRKRTEKEQFDVYGYVIDKLEGEGKPTKWLRLNRMRLIQNSLSKIKATKQLLSTFIDERVLVFCGVIKIAESLGIPSFHSKTKDEEIFKEFAKGKGKHLAVVKIGNAGVTYKPLNRVIINYFDSNEENLVQKINRAMGLEYDNPDKKADIWIITTDEPVERKWLDNALSAMDPEKIVFL